MKSLTISSSEFLILSTPVTWREGIGALTIYSITGLISLCWVIFIAYQFTLLKQLLHRRKVVLYYSLAKKAKDSKSSDKG